MVIETLSHTGAWRGRPRGATNPLAAAALVRQPVRLYLSLPPTTKPEAASAPLCLPKSG